MRGVHNMSKQSSTLADCWQSHDPVLWRGHLDAYPSRISLLGKDNLSDLDRWYRALPAEISARQEAHVTAAELVKIVEWKLTRGKWRPRLLEYAKAHKDAAVVAASAAAFRKVDEEDVAAGFVALTKLKGIGPATASAVMAAHAPKSCPFMSDEAAAAVMPSTKLKYNRHEYNQLAAALAAKAEQLNSKSGKEPGEEWTASDVERSLWSAAASSTGGSSLPKGGRPSRVAVGSALATSGTIKITGRKRSRDSS